ncbi:MAG: SH3 domain-containing protein [Thermodesulfobacteriota bacterium]
MAVMKFARITPGLLLILAGLVLISGCQPPATTGGYPVSPTYNYVVPTMTYLRDCAGYECGVVSEVYSGDRVVVLDRNDFGWVRVQLDRSGAIGWISNDLLSYNPVPASFYVSLTNAYLRSCADYNCPTVELLHRGDRVDKLDQDGRGWWRVRSFQSGKLGWIPVSALSIRSGAPYYYVNVSRLALRSGPGTGYKALTTLGLNNRVEVLGSGAGGWLQVRDTRTNIIGWVYGRYLESFPVSSPRPDPKRSSPSQPEAPKAPAKPKAM